MESLGRWHPQTDMCRHYRIEQIHCQLPNSSRRLEYPPIEGIQKPLELVSMGLGHCCHLECSKELSSPRAWGFLSSFFTMGDDSKALSSLV